MNARERILNTFAGKSVDRPPATCHWWGLYKFQHAGIIRGYEDEGKAWRMNGRELMAVDQRFYEDFKPDTFHLTAGSRKALTSSYAAPDITQDSECLTDIVDAAQKEALLCSVRSMDSREAIDRFIQFRYSDTAGARREFEHVRLLREHYGNAVFLSLNEGNPICEILDPSGVMGFEEGMIALIENPEMMEYLVYEIYDALLGRIRILKECGADAYIGSETYCSNDLISEDLYKSIIFPAQQHFYREVERLGLIPIVYFLGDICPRIKYIKELGARGLMVEESKKNFRLDIGYIYTQLEQSMTLFGNVDSVDLLQKSDAQTVRREAKRQRKLCDKGHFILSNGCPVAFDTPEENIRALLG